MAANKKPKWLITYFCPQCKLDFAMTELDAPCCFGCENTVGNKVLKKEKLTPEAMMRRLELVNTRLEESLRGAYKAAQKEDKNFPEETDLLEAMAKAKKLSENLDKLDLQQPRSSKKSS